VHRTHHRHQLQPIHGRSDISPFAVLFPALPTNPACYHHRLCIGGHFAQEFS